MRVAIVDDDKREQKKLEEMQDMNFLMKFQKKKMQIKLLLLITKMIKQKLL